MVVLINPYSGKPVDASEAAAERLVKVGFRPVVEDVKPEPKRRGRPKKSD